MDQHHSWWCANHGLERMREQLSHDAICNKSCHCHDVQEQVADRTIIQGNMRVTCPSMALSMPFVRAPEMTCPAAPTRTAEASPDMA